MKSKKIFSFCTGTLRGRLILSVAVVHAVLMCIFIIDLTVRQYSILFEDQIDDANNLVKTLSLSSPAWVASMEVSGLQELVESISRDSEVEFASFTSADGKILAHTDRRKMGEYMVDLPKTPMQTILHSKAPLIDVAAPVFIINTHVGWLRIGLGQKKMQAKYHQTVYNGILFALTAIIVGSIIAWIMGRRFTRRLYLIERTINAVKAGNKSARTKLRGGDEAAFLAQEFNSMLDMWTKSEQAEKRFRTLFDNAPDAYMILETEKGRIINCNPMIETIYGCSSSEIIGKTLVDLSPEYQTDNNFSMNAMEPLMAKVILDQNIRFEWVIQRFDKTELWVDISLNIVELDQRKVFLLSMRHISERKRIEKELANMVHALERSNKDLEQFAYVASHDLQEPLRVVISYLQFLEEMYKEKIDEKGRDYILRAVNATKRMQTMIQNLLAYSRISTRGKSFAECDLHIVLEHALENLKTAISGCGAIITHDPLPVITADAAQIEQLFQNLIGNAIKFCDKEPPVIHVGAVKNNEGKIVYSVKDNGIGIEEQYYERIFEIFQRLHGRGKYEGTGIGLSTCRKIVERHNGRIWIDSMPGAGSVFMFTLDSMETIQHACKQ